MAFGLNKVQIIGRLGADVTVNHLTSGGRVANLSIATDESYEKNRAGISLQRIGDSGRTFHSGKSSSRHSLNQMDGVRDGNRHQDE